MLFPSLKNCAGSSKARLLIMAYEALSCHSSHLSQRDSLYSPYVPIPLLRHSYFLIFLILHKYFALVQKSQSPVIFLSNFFSSMISSNVTSSVKYPLINYRDLLTHAISLNQKLFKNLCHSTYVIISYYIFLHYKSLRKFPKTSV